MAVGRDNTHLLELLNRALRDIPQGDQNGFRNRWLTTPIQYGLDPGTIVSWVAPFAAGAVLVVLLVIVWNRRLGRKVTVTQESERAAQAGLVQMSTVFAEAGDPIMIEDLDGNVTELNAAAEEAYGWSRDEMIGKPIQTIVPPDRHDQSRDLLRRCKAGEQIQNIDGLRMSRDGTVIPVLLTLSLLRDADGEPVAVSTVCRQRPWDRLRGLHNGGFLVHRRDP